MVTGGITKSLIVFGLWFSLQGAIPSAAIQAQQPVQTEGPTFEPLDQNLTGLVNGDAVWGDYDNDRDMDLIICGMDAADTARTILFRNDAGIFTEVGTGLPGVVYCSLDFGDYDHDGDLDLLIMGNAINSLTIGEGENLISRVYRNTNGSFTDISAGLPGRARGGAEWGDAEGDGDLDILLSGHISESQARADVFINENGSFSTQIVVSNPPVDDLDFTDSAKLYIGTANWIDFDNNNRLEILTTGLDQIVYRVTTARLFRYENGSYVEVDNDVKGVFDGHTSWGDYDVDGDYDLIINGTTDTDIFENGTRVYRNDNGTLTLSSINIEDGLALVSFADFTNDGSPDIFVSKYNATTIYRNVASTMQEVFEYAGGGGSNGAMAWADYDNDGDLDFVISSIFDANELNTRIFENTEATSSQLLDPPTGLSAFIEDGVVIFTWDGFFEKNQDRPGVSYDVRIGTTPGGSEIYAAHAYPDGQRLLPEPGRTLRGLVTFTDLPDGTYYWSVQAIDYSLIGSAFAEEQIFNIGETSPEPVVQSVLPEAPQLLDWSESVTYMITVVDMDGNPLSEAGVEVQNGLSGQTEMAVATATAGEFSYTLTISENTPNQVVDVTFTATLGGKISASLSRQITVIHTPEGSLIWPVPPDMVSLIDITQEYAAFNSVSISSLANKYHDGIDMVTSDSEMEVIAAAGGKVYDKRASETEGWGNAVIIDHQNGLYTLYAHLVAPVSLAVGADVEPGQSLGKMGASGEVTGVHLHFKVMATPEWSGGYFSDLPDGYFGIRDPRTYIYPFGESEIEPVVMRVEAGDNLLVRAGPGSDDVTGEADRYAPLTKVPDRQRYVVRAQNGEWFKIDLAHAAKDGISGWLYGGFLVEERGIPQVEIPASSNSVFIRTGPLNEGDLTEETKLKNRSGLPMLAWINQRYAVRSQANSDNHVWYEIDLTDRVEGTTDKTGWVRGDVVTYHPGSPVPVSPPNNQLDVVSEVTISWAPVETVDGYKLQVAVDEGFASLVAEEDVAMPPFVLNIFEPTTAYYWRVKGKKANGESSWSQTFTFTSAAGVGVESEPAEIPVGFMLHQNYPNPFNPKTTIAYELVVGQEVRLEVTNMLGKPVRVLVDKYQPAGRYNVEFDASEISSGVYHYTLHTDKGSQTKSLILLQ